MKILRQDGLYSLFKKSLNYLFHLSVSYLNYLYYTTRYLLLADNVVSVNNVRLDLEDNTISADMVKRIRKGHYEQLETKFILTYLRKDIPTIDFGSGVGYTTCLIDRYVNGSVPVFALEANEGLIPVIKRNRELNSGDFTVIHSAYDPQNDTIKFQIAEDFWSSSQYDRDRKSQQETTVDALSLEQLISKYDFTPPIQLVVDIEGGEHNLITDEIDILEANCEKIIVEFHDFLKYDVDYYNSILQDSGFILVDSRRNVGVYENQTFQD
jgi:FkbM family methyltransferase